MVLVRTGDYVPGAMAGTLMSEEGKFRFSITANVAVLIAVVGLIIAVVQKYDAIDTRISVMQESLGKIDAKQGTVESLGKRIDDQESQILLEEKARTIIESKVDALTGLLNEFMGSIRNNRPEPKSTPLPNQ